MCRNPWDNRAAYLSSSLCCLIARSQLMTSTTRLILIGKHYCFVYRHLHRDCAYSSFLQPILYANGGLSAAQGTVEFDFLGLLRTLKTLDSATTWIHHEQPTTESENPLAVVLPFAQTHDIMFDVTTGTFEGKCVERHCSLWSSTVSVGTKAT